MIQFIKGRNYRVALPEGDEATYTVQLRTSQYDGKRKQFQKQIFKVDGVETCNMFTGKYAQPLILSAKKHSGEEGKMKLLDVYVMGPYTWHGDESLRRVNECGRVPHDYPIRRANRTGWTDGLQPDNAQSPNDGICRVARHMGILEAAR